MTTKYIFIGAGVANLAAANRLLSLGETDLLILEKGNKLKKRHCPGIDETTCLFCKNGCYITEGVGGADALFGNKLCYFPASNEIANYFDDDAFTEAMQYLEELLHPFFNSRLNHKTIEQSSVKEYNSVVLSPFEFEKMVGRLSEKLYTANKILENTAIKSITKTSDNLFTIIADDGKSFVAKNIVLGSGKSSNNFLRDIFKNLGINFAENHQDIGIRIETKSENFSENFYYQNDPKIKFTYPGLGSARTFCAISQGQITPVQFGNAFYADGIITKNATGLNNIALMSRTEDKLETDVLENWCKEINSKFGNNLFLAEIDLQKIEKEDIPEMILSKIPSWPSEKHKRVMRLFLNDLFLGEHSILNDKKNISKSSLKVYGPAIDNYLPRPKIRKELSTEVNNVYILGDAVGISRGYVQAMFSGAAWARSVKKENLQQLQHQIKREQWLVSV